MDTELIQRVTLSFGLSDFILFRYGLRLQSRRHALGDATPPADEPQAPAPLPPPGCVGYILREWPVSRELPVLERTGPYYRYVMLQYQHCYIDMAGDFEGYRQKFSSKTRSTISRKVKKFAEHCGGSLKWECFRTPEEMDRFFPLALELSARTYQDRLLDAGLPDDAGYRAAMRQRAGLDEVRAYILFDGERPVSYLFCPVESGVLMYAYLGYDPEYRKHSVGTVLQWLALESLFEERKFRFFDFTDGESDHKRLFATHQQRCANVMFVRADLRHGLVLRGHRGFTRFGEALGRLAERWGVKQAIRRMLRFGFRPSS